MNSDGTSSLSNQSSALESALTRSGDNCLAIRTRKMLQWLKRHLPSIEDAASGVDDAGSGVSETKRELLYDIVEALKRVSLKLESLINRRTVVSTKELDRRHSQSTLI